MIASLTLALAILIQDPSATRMAGDRLLSAAQAGDVFENVSDGNAIRLKHPASGMICQFDVAAQRNNIRVYPVRPEVANRGDDVGCGTTPDMGFTIYATRYQPAASGESAMAQAVEEVEAIWSDVQRLDIPAPAGAPDVRIAAFRARHPNGQSLSTVILIRQAGPWIFKMRASGPPDQPGVLVQTAVERFTAQLPPSSSAAR